MDFVMMIVVAPADQAQEIADSECPMDEWQGIEAAEVTPAMLAQISSALTGEALAEALAATARRRGFALGDDLIRHLLRHARRDMGSLSAIVARLDRASLATGRPMTVALLRQVLESGAGQ